MMSLQEMFPVYFKTEYQRKELICVVCGERARGFNFGAITCMSCKMFFHRNAWNYTDKLKCYRGRNCLINTQTRKHCSYCRLQMCFRMGMQRDLIRTYGNRKYSKLIDDQKQQKSFIKSTQSVDLVHHCDSVSLVDCDWELLRQLSSIFDSYTDHVIHKAREMHDELLPLGTPPLKMRLKATYIYDIANTFAAAVLNFLKFVPQFITLPTQNKLALIRRNTKAMIMFYTSYQLNLKTIQKLCETPYWIASLNCILSSSTRKIFHKLNHQIGQLSFVDPYLIKLIIIILAFSTNNINYDDKIIDNQFNEYHHALLLHQIQNIYVELIWKYLIYRFGEDHAVHYCSQLIKIILDVQMYVSIIDDSKTSSERKFDGIVEKLTDQTH